MVDSSSNCTESSSSFCKRVSFAVKVLFIVSCSEELVVVSSVIDCLTAAISEFIAVLLLSFEVVGLSILSLMAAISEFIAVLLLSEDVMRSSILSLIAECSEELVVVNSDMLVSADDRRASFAVKVLFIVSCSEELVVVSSDIDCLMAAISEFVAELLLSFEVVRLSILSLMAACSEELVAVSSDKSDCMVVRSVFNSSTYSEM